MAPLIELALRRLADSTLTAELRAFQRNSVTLLAPAQPVTINVEALRGLGILPDAYGAALSAMVFPAVLREAWQRVRGAGEAAGSGVQLRILIDDPTSELHGLRWELLRDPATGVALAHQESGSLARLVPSESLHDPVLPARPALRALIAVAGPADASTWGLDPVDVVAEAERALAALGDIQGDVLAGDHPRSRGLATLANLLDGLRGGPHVLYLICHGKATEAGTTLYLVGETGNAAPITGEALAAELRALDPAHRPLLAVLVACEGGSQEQTPLASVGPLLAGIGILAVVAMQAPISLPAAARFTERLLRELRRDGRVDRALAAARREMRNEWWVPVLWLRSRDGLLWRETVFSPATTGGIAIGGNVGTMQMITVTGGSVGTIVGSQHTSTTPASPQGHGATTALRQRLARERETLARHLAQRASTGPANAPPAITAGIREARSAIRQIKAQLQATGVPVADHPDDAAETA